MILHICFFSRGGKRREKLGGGGTIKLNKLITSAHLRHRELVLKKVKKTYLGLNHPGISGQHFARKYCSLGLFLIMVHLFIGLETLGTR